MTRCSRCRHRRDLDGSYRSACRHPRLKGITDDIDCDSFPEPMLMNPKISYQAQLASRILSVRINIEGYSRGLAFWPFNYEPRWIMACEGFQR